MMQAHLIWDWNGTLLADQHVVLAATNEAFARLHFHTLAEEDPVEIAPGLPALTQIRYQELFTRPLRSFYYAVMRRHITESEFARWTDLYRDAYTRRLPAARLTSGARTAVEAWREVGGSQSLLSLSEHESLKRQVERWGLMTHFVRIDGRRGSQIAGHDTKQGALRRHLLHLLEGDSPAVWAAVATRRVAMIGDAVDDVVAARDLGITCILFTGTAVPRASIADVPTAATLSEAVELAQAAVSSRLRSDGTPGLAS